jgi:hypothetical protein
MDFYFIMYISGSITICYSLSYSYINLLSLTLHHLTQKDEAVSSYKMSIIAAILVPWYTLNILQTFI